MTFHAILIAIILTHEMNDEYTHCKQAKYCETRVESWPIIIITERSNETRSEQYGVNLLGISLSIKLVDPSYIKKDRYLSYLYIIYHLFCQKEQTFIVFCKKKFALDIVMIFPFVYKWYPLQCGSYAKNIWFFGVLLD